MQNQEHELTRAYQKLYDIVVRLRAPDGCPWDREQTPLSLRSDLIEETYECVEAINEQDPSHVKEELGDIYFSATLIAYIYEQAGLFSVAEMLEDASEKYIRRHPHVFTKADSTIGTAEVLKNWEKIKIEQEGRKPKDSVLDEVNRGLPPVDRAWKIQKKAAKAGFDWPDATGAFAKVREELGEVEEAAANAAINTAAAQNSGADIALEGEIGDLLFSVINLCRFFDIEPSVALQRTNVKFTERFKHVEKRMKETAQEMNAQNLAMMDQYWDEAKLSGKLAFPAQEGRHGESRNDDNNLS